MKTKIDNKKLGKFMALILRHKPEVIGATLDRNGWLEVDDMIDRINAKYGSEVLNIERLKDIVSEDNKNRYELDNNKIRARQGHSLTIDLSLNTATPPKTLYHGTVSRFLDSIMKNGLIKGSRQYVHLSGDIDTAKNVGSRRGDPVIIKINAGLMNNDGIDFYQSTNGVWLVDSVPAKYLTIEW